MLEFLKILIPYCFGIMFSALAFNPIFVWRRGWDEAKKFYSNWDEGFNCGWKKAEKLFKDYDQGFGDGFESGWDTALEQKEEVNRNA